MRVRLRPHVALAAIVDGAELEQNTAMIILIKTLESFFLVGA